MFASLRATASTVAPGLAAAAATAGTATLVAKALPNRLHISAIPVSIVLGAAAANLGPLAAPSVAAKLKPGLSLATSTVLRAGIVCVGAKLSGAQIMELGWTTVPAAACSVGAGVLLIPRLAAAAGLAPRLGSLLAAGTSICGVTAISAVAPAIGATQAEIALAVANVVAYGTLGMVSYPHLAHALFPAEDSKSIGLFLGLAVHDTAQVMGCAASYAEQYADAAVVGAAAVAKLTRNVFLAGVVPLMAVRHGGGGGRVSLATAVPTFVAGFVGMAALRTAGDAQLASGGRALWLLEKERWRAAADWVGGVLGTKALLGTGLAGVGLSVKLESFRGVGPKVFLVGGAGASLVGGVGLSVALLVSSLRAQG
jgi:uncharacterized integral membrane protein (TIGR00698 family)